MINITETNYPFNSYIPSKLTANLFASIVYISLVAWFAQSLFVKCQPRFLSVFMFISHLTTFIELILRGTIPVDLLYTKVLFRITGILLSISPRFILIANYHCLVELRGKTPRRILDRVIDILLPFGAITAGILLVNANQSSFNPNRFQLSFRLRQASAGLVLGLTILFYIVWYLAVPHARRLYVFPLLSISSICILIEAIYMQALSLPSLFFKLNQDEIWFYAFHKIPIVLALITWSIFHPRRLLPPPERDVPHDETGKELLPPPPTN